MAMPHIRPMGIGEVLDRSFQVLRHHFGTLFVTAIIGTTPLILLYLLAGVPYGTWVPDPSGAQGLGLLFVGLMLAMMLGMAVVWAALTRQADNAVTGGPVEVADGLRHGLGALLRLIGVGILAYLALLGLFLPAALVAGVIAAVAVPVLGTGIGAVVMVVAIAIPILLAMVVWMALTFLLLPVVVNERAGPIRALRRANELAKGGRLRVCATAIVAWLVVALPTMGLPFLFGLGASLWDPQVVGTASSTQLYLYQAVTFLVGGATTPFLATTMVLTYYDRRVRREGLDVELAAEGLPAGV